MWSQATLVWIISVFDAFKTTAGHSDSPQNCALEWWPCKNVILGIFCGTQWRHWNDYSVKTMLCKTPSPYVIVLAHWNIGGQSYWVSQKRPILQMGLTEAPYVYFAGGCECVIFIDYDSSIRNHVAEANTSPDSINSANTVSILGHNRDSWHNIEVVPTLPCKRHTHI